MYERTVELDDDRVGLLAGTNTSAKVILGAVVLGIGSYIAGEACARWKAVDRARQVYTALEQQEQRLEYRVTPSLVFLEPGPFNSAEVTMTKQGESLRATYVPNDLVAKIFGHKKVTFHDDAPYGDIDSVEVAGSLDGSNVMRGDQINQLTRSRYAELLSSAERMLK